MEEWSGGFWRVSTARAVAGEASAGAGSGSPTPAIFIGNLGMGKKEFFFRIFQHRVIEVKLSFERAIGHALTTPEQVNDLIE